MEKEIEVNGCKYRMHGKWAINGAYFNFDGTLTKEGSDQPNITFCKVPLSAIKKHGKEFIEEDFVQYLMEEIEANMKKLNNEKPGNEIK